MRNSQSADLPSDSEEGYISARFKMPAKSLFGTMLMLYGRGWMLGCAVPFIAGLAVWGITGDLRWLIVSWMFLFIVLPMIAALLYFSYGLRRECFLNAVEHEVALSSSGLVITLYRRIIEDSASETEAPEEKDDEEPDSEDDDSEDRIEKSYVFEIPYTQLRPFHVAGSAVVIPAGKGFVWLPLSAFPSSACMTEFMQRISQGIVSSRCMK